MNLITLPTLPAMSATIAGREMQYTSQVFLSSTFTTTSLPLTAIDDFSLLPSVSASFPAFSGIDITQFCTVKEVVVIDINALANQGLFFNSDSQNFDIIFLNIVGYSKLSDSGSLIVSTTVSGVTAYYGSTYINVVSNPVEMTFTDTFISLDNYISISGFAPWKAGNQFMSITFSN